MILYPAFEKYLGAEGKKLPMKIELNMKKFDLDLFIFSYFNYKQVKKLLHKLKSTSVSDPQHRQIFDELMKNLLEHVKGYLLSNYFYFLY